MLLYTLVLNTIEGNVGVAVAVAVAITVTVTVSLTSIVSLFSNWTEVRNLSKTIHSAILIAGDN